MLHTRADSSVWHLNTKMDEEVDYDEYNVDEEEAEAGAELNTSC